MWSMDTLWRLTHDALSDEVVATVTRVGSMCHLTIVSGVEGSIMEESYADKPLLYRLHSGEAFGDGGLVVAMLWGLALLTLTITGLIIYLKLWRPGQTGVRKVFW